MGNPRNFARMNAESTSQLSHERPTGLKSWLAFRATERFRFRILPAIAILLLAPAYWIYVFAPAVGTVFHDDGLYLVTAQALAHGSGYRIVSLPAEIPQTKYPILYPAILSGVIRIFPRFPQDVPALKALSLLFTILWCVASYKLLLEMCAPRWTYWILFFTLAFPWVLNSSSATLPDTLFALSSTVGALLLMRATAESDSTSLANVVCASIFCGLAVLARSAGVPLFLAGAIVLLYRRMYGKLVVFASTTFIVCLPWLYWQRVHPAPVDRVLTYYSKFDYVQTNIFALHCGSTLLLKIVTGNLFFLLRTFSDVLGGEVLGILASFGIWAVVVRGFVRSLRKGLTVICAWCVLYLGVLLCCTIPRPRYLIPLLPLLFTFFVEGLRGAMPTSPKAVVRRRYLAGALICLLTARAGVSVWEMSRETLRKGTPAQRPSLEVLDWNEMMGLAQWIRDNAPKDAIVSADLDPVFYLFGRRKAIRPFRTDFYAWLTNTATSYERSVLLKTFEDTSCATRSAT